MLAEGAQVVYNLPSWSLGFSTAIRLYGDYRAAVGYVLKYITKAPDKIGGRWYYSGGALERPDASYLVVDFDQLCNEYSDRAKPYKVEAMNCYGISIFLEGDNDAIRVE